MVEGDINHFKILELHKGLYGLQRSLEMWGPDIIMVELEVPVPGLALAYLGRIFRVTQRRPSIF